MTGTAEAETGTRRASCDPCDVEPLSASGIAHPRISLDSPDRAPARAGVLP